MRKIKTLGEFRGVRLVSRRVRGVAWIEVVWRSSRKGEAFPHCGRRSRWSNCPSLRSRSARDQSAATGKATGRRVPRALLRACLWARGELVDRRRLIGPSRFQQSTRKTGFIRRVREMLGLHAETGALLIDLPALSGDAAVQKIARVELHAGLSRVDLENTPGDGLIHPGCQRELAAPAVEDPIMVVAP